ncbi:MAG TPA: type II toxin-antitoxin system prevent-host-death family antitoxin [Candidatus Limnocylindrales bacterium]|nr:type II toxin-antitoxin system prevent-host-death family antitoxin [Candidatus Limnocylindrales bacterium]
MSDVTIRDLCDHADDVVDRVAAGEHVVITRGGRPVAELRPFVGRGLPAAALLARWRRLPAVDPAALRGDVDEVLGRR